MSKTIKLSPTEEELAQEELISYVRRQFFYSKYNLQDEFPPERCGTQCGPIFIYIDAGLYVSIDG